MYEGKDLVNFNKNELNLVTKKFDLIESIKVKKIYPNKLIFTIFEKKPIAILFEKKDKFFITSNNEKVKYFEDERLSNLPSIIGKKENFVSLYGTLLDLNFPINKIKSYNHFEVGRWDINLQDNRTIKLPPIDYKESLIEFIKLNKNVNFVRFINAHYENVLELKSQWRAVQDDAENASVKAQLEIWGTDKLGYR